MRRLLTWEVRRLVQCPVQACSPGQCTADPHRGEGALVLSPPGLNPDVAPALPRSATWLPILYSSASDHLERVKRLTQPSVIVVASVSAEFLRIARGVLSPLLGTSHTLVEYRVTDTDPEVPSGADLVFCDAIAFTLMRALDRRRNVIPYFLLAPAFARQIATVVENRDGSGGRQTAAARHRRLTIAGRAGVAKP